MASSVTQTRSNQAISVDLSDPITFRGAILSPEQMNQRYQILTALEEQLDEEGKALEKKDAKELQELVDLVRGATTHILEGQHPIHRLSTPWYHVQFSPTIIDDYRVLGQRIDQLPTTGIEILRAVQPDKANNWFQGAILDQVNHVFTAGFMSMLRNTLMANICVLRATLLLVKEPKLFRDVLDLYAESNNLYNTQVSYNRDVELSLLKSGEQSYLSIKHLYGDIRRICGPALEEKQEVIERASAFVKQEAAVSIKASNEIADYCDIFLQQISALEGKVETCINHIFNKQEAVVAAMDQIKKVLEDQRQLHDKQKAIELKFEDFQRKREEEIKSRKEVITTNSYTQYRTETRGFWLWSWPHETFRSTSSCTTVKIEEKDLGSKEIYQEFVAAQAEGEALNKALEQAKKTLAQSMLASGVMRYGQGEGDLEKAATSLSTAMTSVKVLKTALLERKSQAQDQVKACKAFLENFEHNLVRLADVFYLLENRMQGLIKKQALWLGSTRQTLTLQSCRELEQKIVVKAIDALANTIHDDFALVKFMGELQVLFPQDIANGEVESVVEARLISIPKMLEITLEEIDK